MQGFQGSVPSEVEEVYSEAFVASSVALAVVNRGQAVFDGDEY